jgi:hypothetical protein
LERRKLLGYSGERHEKIVLFEPSTNQFGYVTRGYPIIPMQL